MLSIAALICVSVNAADQVVTNNSNSGAGSLRQAIADVTDGGSITFNLSTGSETITISSELSITKAMTIDGANTAGSGTDVTVKVTTPGVGGSQWRIFNINASGMSITISNMTINGGDISTVPDNGGGILCQAGTLYMNGVTISGSKANYGGAIFTPDATTISNCTFNHNTAARGGALFSKNSSLYVINSTFTGNQATSYGGAFYLFGSSVHIIYSTITGNSSTILGGGICGSSSETVYLANSILQNNTCTGGANFRNTTLYSFFSWLGDGTGTPTYQATAPSINTAYTAGDILALASNGGPTQTMEIPVGKPPYQTGGYMYHNVTDGYYLKANDNNYYNLIGYTSFTPTSPATDKITTDQRGEIRPSTPNIGSYDYRLAVAVTASTGTPEGQYNTLREAFAMINSGNHKGDITIKINKSTTETSSAVLNASLSGSADYSSINIYPTATGLSITGNLGLPIIDLNGADNVTIDGRVNATGSTNDMIITNTKSNDDNQSTIRFTNDATYNTVKYCVIKGSASRVDKGILLFTGIATTTGNSNNSIDHNEITNNGGNRPRNALFSYGKSEAVPNITNTVTNNNFYDVLNFNLQFTRAIALNTSDDQHPNNSYNTGWTISGNSFYDTQNFATSNAAGYAYAIYVWADQGSGFTISNNYIGGSAPLCSGTWTKTNGNIGFTAIFLNAKQAGATNYIQGNTLKNFNYSNTGNYFWYGINFNSGDNNISNNCIGATTGTGSIVFTTGSTDGTFIGIVQGVYCSSTCNNNTIGSITVANSNQAYATNFIGMWVPSYCGTGTTSNNIIGSTTTPNSINATSASTANAQTVVGIKIQGGSTLSIANNTVANLTNGTTNTTTSTQGYIYGIYSFQGINTITGNTLHDLTIANADTARGPINTSGNPTLSLSAGGIVAPIYNGSAQTISGNTIYNISNTNSTFAGTIAGLYYFGRGSSNTNSINRNFIYNLFLASGSSGKIYGIDIAAGPTTCSNNIITLGGTTNSTLYGIYESGTTWDFGYPQGYNNNIYHNTVYLGGSTSDASKSYCLYSRLNNNTRNFRNNIFNNVRSTESAVNQHYTAWFNYTSSSGLTLDNNDYYASGTGGVLGYYNSANVTTLPLISGKDVNSKSANPGFASAGGTEANDYLPSNTSFIGATGTGITTDYADAERSATIPSMGAFEYDVYPNITVNATSGTLYGEYPTLKAAFDKINDGTHKGIITITINGSTTETASAVLYHSGYTPAMAIGSSYSSVSIYPTFSGLSISGNLASPLIDLNGADNVTIDGRVNATGSTKDLIITNTSTSSTAGTSTIRFINDATSNTAKYCTIKGSSTATVSGGIVFFSTSTGSTGNDGNLIDNNNITSSADANRPLYAVVSIGTAAKQNSNNTISNNNIYDFLNRTAESYGIYTGNNSTSFSVTGNNLYETTSFIPSAGATYYGIRMGSNGTENFTVSGNQIGGHTAGLIGTWSMTNSAVSFSFTGISLSVGTDVNTSVQYNTVSNISINTSSNNPFLGIYAVNGNIDIGTSTGNTVGSSTGNGSIQLTSSNVGGAYSYGIRHLGSHNVNIQNNIVGSITASGTAAHSFYAIDNNAEGGTVTINNNSIGSIDSGTTNSINASSAASSVAQLVFGIRSFGSVNVTISANTISKLTNATTNATAATTGLINGIYASSGINTISDNTVRDLTIANANSAGDYQASVIGIVLNNTTAAAQSVSGNTIYNLSNTRASFAGNVVGLFYNGSTTASTVSNNFIHSLSISSPTTAANIYGIKIQNGKTTWSNNIISVGSDLFANVYGIYEKGDAGNDNSLFYNTVYVSGDVGSNEAKSYALFSATSTNTRDFRNNIFDNQRFVGSKSPGAIYTNYAAWFDYAVSTNLTLGNNDYYVSVMGSGTLGYFNSADVSSLPIIAGMDADSKSVNPVFESAGGTAAANYIPSETSLVAATGTGITTDYDESTRSTSYPSMGAHEYTVYGPTPTLQLTELVFSAVGPTQMTIGWTNGNGAKRAIFVKEGSGSITNPSNNTTYTASSNWASKGTELGTSGYYCVYNSNSNTVTITGLTSGTEYTVQGFEYNGLASGENYNITTATNNPKAQTSSEAYFFDGTNYYSSLTNVISGIANGSIVTLLLAYNCDANVNISKSFTLDLNGKSITNTGNYTTEIADGTSFNLKNTGVGGTFNCLLSFAGSTSTFGLFSEGVLGAGFSVSASSTSTGILQIGDGTTALSHTYTTEDPKFNNKISKILVKNGSGLILNPATDKK
jgi:hypothetical protein